MYVLDSYETLCGESSHLGFDLCVPLRGGQYLCGRCIAKERSGQC